MVCALTETTPASSAAQVRDKKRVIDEHYTCATRASRLALGQGDGDWGSELGARSSELGVTAQGSDSDSVPAARDCGRRTRPRERVCRSALVTDNQPVSVHAVLISAFDRPRVLFALTKALAEHDANISYVDI